MKPKVLTVGVRNAKLPHAARAGLYAAGAVLAAATCSYAPAAAAQENPAVLPTLEEVVVTARRREESLEDVPIAITAMSAEDLRQQNIRELSDLALHVPSMAVSAGGPTTNSPVVVLRGQRPSEVMMTLDPAVPLYFADVVLTPTMGTNLSMYDLANVQVLKGPQGTLFGRNSTGGAVLLTPQGPGEEFGGYAEARLGNYSLYQFDGAVDVPVNDELAVRFAGQSVDRDGYQSNVANNPLSGDDKYWDENSYGLRMVARYTPLEGLQNLTTVAYDENEMLSRAAVPKAFNASVQLGALVNAVFNGRLGGLFGTPSATMVDDAIARQRRRDAWHIELDTQPREKIRNWFAANTTEYDLAGNLTIKNIFGYRNLDMTSMNDADGTAVPLFGAITSKTQWYTPSSPGGKNDASQYSDELQLLGKSFDDRLDWIVGAFWMQTEGTQDLPTQIVGANPAWPAGPSPIPNPQLQQLWAVAQNGLMQNSPRGNIDNEAWAVFGEGTWTFSEQWSLTLGARQTWDERAMTAQNLMVNTTTGILDCSMWDESGVPLPNTNCERNVDHGFDKATGRASVNWSPMDDMLVYLSAASGYRTGGFNLRGTNNFSLQPFEPETVTTYELGHKTDWHLFDLAAMRTNLALYLQKYDDIQKTVSGVDPQTGNFATYTINAAKAEIKGVELDVMIAPIESLTISLAYSYVDAGYDEWDRIVPEYNQLNNLPLTSTLDFSDAPFEYIPENSFTASVRYTLPLDAAIGEVSLMSSVYWQDHMATNAGAFLWPSLGWAQADLDEALATVQADGYTVYNFRVDWESVMGSKLDVAAYIDNAFDEEYITGGLSVPDSLGWVGQTYGPPRTYGASLRYRF